MKYIRTKNYDLIMKVSDKIVDNYGTYYLYEKETKWFENEILKVADTIEELKDFYVVDCPQDRKMNRVFTTKQETLHYSQDCLRPQGIEHTIYAAIWTDKGLIYVAKMNEKGELELL